MIDPKNNSFQCLAWIFKDILNDFAKLIEQVRKMKKCVPVVISSGGERKKTSYGYFRYIVILLYCYMVILFSNYP